MYNKMKRYWKWILTVVAILIAGLLIWYIVSYNAVPRLSERDKGKVEQVFHDQMMGHSKRDTIIWYDENGYVEEENVWRYIGTYGDCHAFLWIGDGMSATMEQLSPPDLLQGLSRDVYYPNFANVMLYHTKRRFNPFDRTEQMQYLHCIENREEWLTDEQLEQLTQDIEKLAAAHE